jgi:hypothetical protein
VFGSHKEEIKGDRKHNRSECKFHGFLCHIVQTFLHREIISIKVNLFGSLVPFDCVIILSSFDGLDLQ